MKKIICVLLLANTIVSLQAQQSFSLKKYFAKKVTISKDKDGKEKNEINVVKLKRFGIIGMGNLNTESFENINSSGKFSCYVRPLIFGKKSFNDITLNLSFNKNANNNDSLLATTILFPEIGNSSFTGGIESSLFIGGSADDKTSHFIAPFFEFSQKSIKAEIDKEEKFFSLLHYTLGFRYVFRYYFINDDDEVENIALAITPYLSIYNIPDEDNDDFRFLMQNPDLPSSFNAKGIKLSFQYKGFQVFADFRHVPGSQEKIPVRSLRGFNSNIGIIFNTEIIEK